jgi:hypothetical protein
MKMRRIQNGSSKFKTYNDNSYKNTNAKCEARKHISKNITVNKCCVNNIVLDGILWDDWKNNLCCGNTLILGNSFSLDISGKTFQYNNIIKNVEIYNHTGAIRINGKDCSNAFTDFNNIDCPKNTTSGIKIVITLEITTCEYMVSTPTNPFKITFRAKNGDIIGKELSEDYTRQRKNLLITLNKTIKNDTLNTTTLTRNPIGGYRKSLCETGNVREIYKDPHSKSYATDGRSGCVSYNNIIRSGMQPIQQPFNCDTECCKDKYKFSYNEVNKTRFSNCDCGKNGCGKNKIKMVSKLNNSKFKVQGAVSSSSRLERLKLDTLMDNNSKCKKGPYFAGNPRFTGFPHNKCDKC